MIKSRTSKNQSKTEIALKESEQRYRTTLMSVGDGVIATDIEGRVEMMNPVAEALTGWIEEEACGKPLEEIFCIIDEDTRKSVENPVRHVMREGMIVGLANHSLLIAKDGVEHPIADSAALIRNEKEEITGVVLVFRDQVKERAAQFLLMAEITERKRMEESLRKINRTYSLLSDINQAIVRTRKPEELFEKVCNISVKQGGFGMVWIGLADESSQKLRVIARAGKYEDYFENINISLNGDPLNYCPIDSVLRQGKHNIFNIIENGDMAPFQKVAYDLGFRTSASFPLKVSDIIKGALTFYSDEPDFFDETELKLLDELAMDISFAMEYAEKEDERLQAEIMLRAEKDRIRTILDMVGDPIFVKDNDHRITLANNAFYDIFCLDEKSVIGYTLVEAVPENERQHFLEVDRRVLDTGISDMREEELTVKDLTRTIITRKTCFIDESGKRFLVGSIHDITDRKRSQEALMTSEERFRIAAETSNDVVYEWDLKQKVIWFGKIDEMLGYDPGEFPRTLEGLGASVHPEDWVRVMGAVQAHLDGRAPYAEDYRVLMKDGTFRWWSARGAVARMPDGTPVRWVGTVTDITERKLAEETLLKSEARYKTLVENIPQKILMKDINYRWISINENLARDFGISPEEVVGKLDRDLFSKELADKYHADDVRIITTGKTEELEEKYVVDGKETWVNTIKTAVRDDKGAVVGLLGIFWDITGRKQAEEALKISKERLLFATEGANLGIWNWNIVTGELIWSDQCKALFGIPPDETMSYQRFSDALHPDDRERTNMAVKDTLDNHKDFDIEYRSLWPDDSIHWLSAKGRGFYDSTGQAVRLEGIVLDITRRKQEEETLRIKNQVFEDSIASQSIADSTGLITHVNPAFLHLWGYASKEQAIGNSVGSFFADQADAAPVLEALATHDAWEGEFRAMRVDGTSFISRGFATSLRDTRGELIGYQSTNLDVTKEKEAKEEIIKLNAELEDRVVKRTSQLEASNRELEAFSYSVSHDLRAPLRHVSGYVELLNKHFQSDLPEKGQHYLNSIADSVHVMGMLIDDLLQFSRSGRMEMHQSDFDMNEIVKEVRESLSQDNPDRKIEWVIGKLPFINGDEAMLRLVWMNLLSNAVKFTRQRKKARIEIGATKEKKEFVFFVRDNGVGFDMQYAQKLFGVFQRLHPTEEFEGTGIGLANVHRIVLRHGGRTWAESEPDKGALFNFSIPK